MYSRILVALDGSEFSASGGQIALALARGFDSEILACHVYDAKIHRTRFREMEPGLPARFQGKESIHNLRKAHDSLILDGFLALSQGYMEHFVADARQIGLTAREVTIEGRNYAKILEIALDRKADLIVLGAHGIGAFNDGLLGSTAARVLRHARCDVLIARRALGDGAILVGIDGSDQAMAALRKGAILGRTLERSLHLAAAYDPDFHNEVFKAMAHSLSAERQEEVGLARQEGLHEQFIDGGLNALYKTFLERIRKQAGIMDIETSSKLLRGKPYQALVGYSGEIGADLVVVGRHGYHQEKVSQIGSNAEALVRLGKTNTLIVAFGK
jgi:nucleotide-binding universal stress UspA family protein